MIVFGIDLSGPTNTADTCLTIFEQRKGFLRFMDARSRLDDAGILSAVRNKRRQSMVIGIDAPLSYQSGGGDRPSDARLRRVVSKKGGGVGVMTPTMTRMSYLTLRGIALTRLLEKIEPPLKLRIVEVHPGAVMLLRNAPPEAVKGLKRDGLMRQRLLEWLGDNGLEGLPRRADPGDHFVAACAAALGAWAWARGNPAWIHPADPPLHPYDFAC